MGSSIRRGAVYLVPTTSVEGRFIPKHQAVSDQWSGTGTTVETTTTEWTRRRRNAVANRKAINDNAITFHGIQQHATALPLAIDDRLLWRASSLQHQ